MVGRLLRALLVALLPAMAIVATPSPAAANADYLDVRITSVSTPRLNFDDPNQVVELSGTLTNVSTVPIRYVNVHFWRLPQPMTSAEQITETRGQLPPGARLVDEPAGNLHILTREEEFGPGERADFTVRTTVAQLTTGEYALTQDDAAYLLGVQVRGIPADGDNQIVGRDNIVLAATAKPVASSALVVLAATPSWLPDGTFLNESLAADLNARLDTLLTSAERPGVSAAVDPALYEAARRMSEPHIVAGEERPGSGVALRWVQRVDALADDGRLMRLPYGDPDLVRADAAEELDRVLSWEQDLGLGELAKLPSVVILDDGATSDIAAKLPHFDTVVVRNADGATPGTPRLLGAAPQGAVSSLPPGIQLARKVADELVAPRPPLYLIDSPEAAAVDAELEPWRIHVPATTSPAEPLTWGDAVPPAPWPAVAAALASADENAALIQDVTPDAPAFAVAEVGAMAYSKGFASEADAVSYVGAAAPPAVDLSQVTLRSAASYVMGSRTNTFPATLTNNLSIPVTVGVEFISDAPQRIRVPPVEPLTVGAGESVTITITPEAAANGVALVQAQLVTTSGAVIGAPAPIEITATDLGRVGWVIILSSGAVVVGGTAWRIRTVRRERAKVSGGTQ